MSQDPQLTKALAHDLVHARSVADSALVAALVTAIFSAGCSSVQTSSKTLSCTRTDWHELGHQRAMAGHQRPDRSLVVDACEAEAKSPEDTSLTLAWDSYLAGFVRGQNQYCGMENARILGRLGFEKPSRCPEDLQLQVNRAYARGIEDREALDRQSSTK
jgi:hypothetical protein